VRAAESRQPDGACDRGCGVVIGCVPAIPGLPRPVEARGNHLAAPPWILFLSKAGTLRIAMPEFGAKRRGTGRAMTIR
jgi:hypothetical protein